MSGFHPTQARYRHRRGGSIIWASEVGDVDIALASSDFAALLREQPYTQNALADEGEEDILDVYFRGATAPSNFFLGLVNDTPVETDGLTDLTGEPSGNGYSRQTIPATAVGWPTLALDSGDFQADSTVETFTASGGSIGPVTYSFLATTVDNTGVLVAYVALSTTRTLTDGDSLDVDYNVKLA